MGTSASSGENTAVDEGKVGDRVAMLSLSKDGTPDQTNPTLIGDPEFVREAARRQFTEQAVSAADDAARTAAAKETAEGEKLKQDPSIAKAEKEHEKIAAAAEKRADAVVSELHTDA